ncbi:hypothetical protein KFE25_014329 [Diacronema lutheri]|uniref:Uncharacterized protein n=2 Tax=Diacronema lutheri TaxID=2081491 RepID=A0A8J5X6Z9_DIALT|nr:hypothetical protein KFE25_014329 [Diacronema lutheri]
MNEPARPRKAALVACALACSLAAVLAVHALARSAPRSAAARGGDAADGPGRLAEELSGWLEGTAEPWLEVMFPRSSHDDQFTLASGGGGSADEVASSVPVAPPPSCPPGKLADAYHLNKEQGTCQQVCIGSGLRGVFIAHGGALGGTCVALGYRSFLAEGKRAGVHYFIFAPSADGLLAASGGAVAVVGAGEAGASGADGAEPAASEPASAPSPDDGADGAGGQTAAEAAASRAARDAREGAADGTSASADGSANSASGGEARGHTARSHRSSASSDAAARAEEREHAQRERDAASEASRRERALARSESMRETAKDAHDISRARDVRDANSRPDRAERAAEPADRAGTSGAPTDAGAPAGRAGVGAAHGGALPPADSRVADAWLVAVGAATLLIGCAMGAFFASRVASTKLTADGPFGCVNDGGALVPLPHGHAVIGGGGVHFAAAPGAHGADGATAASSQPGNSSRAGWFCDGAVSPVRVPICGRVVQLVTEGETAIALTEEGTVYTWLLPSADGGSVCGGGGGWPHSCSGRGAHAHSPGARTDLSRASPATLARSCSASRVLQPPQPQPQARASGRHQQLPTPACGARDGAGGAAGVGGSPRVTCIDSGLADGSPPSPPALWLPDAGAGWHGGGSCWSWSGRAARGCAAKSALEQLADSPCSTCAFSAGGTHGGAACHDGGCDAPAWPRHAAMPAPAHNGALAPAHSPPCFASAAVAAEHASLSALLVRPRPSAGNVSCRTSSPLPGGESSEVWAEASDAGSGTAPSSDAGSTLAIGRRARHSASSLRSLGGPRGVPTFF